MVYVLSSFPCSCKSELKVLKNEVKYDFLFLCGTHFDYRAVISDPKQPEDKNVDIWSLVHPFLSENREKIAFICTKRKQKFTYGDVYDKALRWANVLEDSFPEKSPTVVTFTSSVGVYPIMNYGTMAAGALACPMMENYHEELVAFIVKAVEADVVVVEDFLLPIVEKVIKRLNINPKVFVSGICEDPAMSFDNIINSSKAPRPIRKKVNPDSPCAVFFSSGTTGEPKGIVHTHRKLSTLFWVIKESFYFKTAFEGESQNFLVTTYPAAHFGSTIIFTIIPLLKGGGSIIIDRTDFDGINNAIMEYKVKTFFVRPFAVPKLVELPDIEKILASVEVIVTIGSNPEMHSQRKLLERVPHLRFVDTYGLTESVLATQTLESDEKIVDGTSPVPGATVIIRDIRTGQTLNVEEQGMIITKCPWSMKEYLNKPDATREIFTDDGFLITGDIGYISKEKRLIVSGRAKDILVVDGKTVSPSPLEDILSKHPSVLEVAVIGTPHTSKGQVAKAFVISKDKSTTAEELVEFCDAQTELPEEKLLGGVVFVDHLLRNGLGKVLKKELRRLDWGEGS